jgi:hypothetical protein
VVNIVTAEQVYDLAGVGVEHTTIARAQLTVSTAAGVALDDADIFAALTTADQRHLTSAVIWQAVYLDAHPDAFAGGEQPANVLSAAANGASITFRTDADAELSGLALRELSMLSWRSQPVTVKPLRPDARLPQRRGPQPDPWVSLL